LNREDAKDAKKKDRTLLHNDYQLIVSPLISWRTLRLCGNQLHFHNLPILRRQRFSINSRNAVAAGESSLPARRAA
jgi:hypothetical protein